MTDYKEEADGPNEDFKKSASGFIIVKFGKNEGFNDTFGDYEEMSSVGLGVFDPTLESKDEVVIDAYTECDCLDKVYTTDSIHPNDDAVQKMFLELNKKPI